MSGLVRSHLIVHLHGDPEHPMGEDETDEEYWDVVTLDDAGEGMVTMTEATLASILGGLVGFKDYTIVPVEKEDNG